MAEAQATPQTSPSQTSPSQTAASQAGAAAAARRTSAREEGAAPTNGERRSFSSEAGHATEAARRGGDEMVNAARDLSHTTARATREIGERSRRAASEAAAGWRGAMEPFFSLPMEMNRWFNELWGQGGADTFSGLRPARPFAAWSMAPLLGLPPADVKETRDAYELCVELPGLSREDIELQVQGDALVISGQKAEARSDAIAAYRVSERRFGRFERRFPIPPEVERDQVKAAFHDGVLTVTLPKSAEAAHDHHRIEIQG